MAHFYYVRHGQTAWNAEHRICGRRDIPLTETGREQAAAVGKKILEEKIRIHEILCSPLSRARETAQIISEITGIPVRTDDRLIEQDFGIYEGTLNTAEAFLRDKEQFACSYEGGESMLRVAHRIYSLLEEIRPEAEAGKVYLLAAHNGLARVVHTYFHDMSNEEFARHMIPNGELLRYEFPELPESGEDKTGGNA